MFPDYFHLLSVDLISALSKPPRSGGESAVVTTLWAVLSAAAPAGPLRGEVLLGAKAVPCLRDALPLALTVAGDPSVLTCLETPEPAPLCCSPVEPVVSDETGGPRSAARGPGPAHWFPQWSSYGLQALEGTVCSPLPLTGPRLNLCSPTSGNII